MPVPWSQFEPPYDPDGPPFIKKDQKRAWASQGTQFYVVGIKGPVRGAYGPQWQLTLHRSDNKEPEVTFSMKNNESRDIAMREAQEALRKGEPIGPCVLIEKEGDNGLFWVIEDATAVQEAQAFTNSAGESGPPDDDFGDLPF